MNNKDIELLDDELDISEIKPIAPVDIDITKPIEIVNEIEDEENKPTLIDPDAVLKSVTNVNTKLDEPKEKKQSTNQETKMISPEDVISQVGIKTPQMISPEDVIAQVGSTPSQVPSKTLINVQKKLEQVEGLDKIGTDEVESYTQTNPIEKQTPKTVYIPPVYEDNEKKQKVENYKKLNKDYRITLLFAAVVILFSLGIITSVIDTSSTKKNTKTKLNLEAETNIIENETGNSYFYAPINNKVKSGTSDETTYYLLGDEKSGQSEIFDILSKRYITQGTNVDFGQYDNLVAVGPIKDNKSVDIVLPTNYSNLNERLIKTSNKDGSIIVIKYSNGISKKVEEHLRLMNQLGAEKTIIFINLDDDSKDANDMIKDLKKILKDTGYDENTPIIVGEANNEESIKKLYEEMKEWIKIVPSAIEEPLDAHIINIAQDKDSTQINIQIEKGTIKTGQKIKLLGSEFSQTETVSEIHINNNSKEEASAKNEYDDVSIILKLNNSSLKNATEIVSEKGYNIHSKFYAIFYFSDDNNQKNHNFNNNYTTEIHLKNNVNGKISIPKGVNYITKGVTTNLVIELSESVPIHKGQQFTINDQVNNVFGYGEVVEIIE